MEPIDELSTNLTSLLRDIAYRRYELNREGQTVLLDDLRKLMLAAEKLDRQLQALKKTDTCSPPRRPSLYLVE